MFKKLFGMVKQEYAPLTDDEMALVSAVPAKYNKALSGSRNACYLLSIHFSQKNTEGAYLWATIALLAGHREAANWMSVLDRQVPRERRFYLETVARKWYNLHKEDFTRTKMAAGSSENW